MLYSIVKQIEKCKKKYFFNDVPVKIAIFGAFLFRLRDSRHALLPRSSVGFGGRGVSQKLHRFCFLFFIGLTETFKHVHGDGNN